MIVVAIIVWFICGIISANICRNKSQSGCAGFALGFILGPLGIIIALVMGPGLKCPACMKGVDKEARLCPHCRSALTPQSERRAQQQAAREAAKKVKHNFWDVR